MSVTKSMKQNSVPLTGMAAKYERAYNEVVGALPKDKKIESLITLKWLVVT